MLSGSFHGQPTPLWYKRWAALVLVFIILLFLFRIPITRWISGLPDSPPYMSVGECVAHDAMRIGHVHITPATSGNSIIISWSTNYRAKLISVQYGETLSMEYEAFAALVEIPGEKSALPFVYYSQIHLNSPGDKYYFRVCCGKTVSKIYSFNAWAYGNEWVPNVMVFNGLSPSYVYKENVLNYAKENGYDLLVHMGDTGTSLSDDEGRNGDKFFTIIEEMSSKIPTLLIPGERDSADKFSHHHHRIPFPGSEWPVNKDTFHTVIGPIQIIGFNSELILNSSSRATALYELKSELFISSKKRRYHPWLVVMSNKPVICADKTDSEHSKVCKDVIELLLKYNVNLYIAGRSSKYARTWPLDESLQTESQYDEPKGITIVSLGETDVDRQSDSPALDEKLLATSSPDSNIYARLNATTELLCWQAKRIDNDKVLDSFCIKDVHQLSPFSRMGRFYTHARPSYDKTAWLILVIMMLGIFLGVFVFRRKLMGNLCTYMHSGNGIPIYGMKLSSQHTS